MRHSISIMIIRQEIASRLAAITPHAPFISIQDMTIESQDANNQLLFAVNGKIIIRQHKLIRRTEPFNYYNPSTEGNISVALDFDWYSEYHRFFKYHLSALLTDDKIVQVVTELLLEHIKEILKELHYE